MKIIEKKIQKNSKKKKKLGVFRFGFIAAVAASFIRRRKVFQDWVRSNWSKIFLSRNLIASIKVV